MQLSQLGYGSIGLRGPRTWGVRGVADQDPQRFLHAVLDTGIHFIDTSPDDGLREQRIGAALRSRRSEYHLATKCGCVDTQHDDQLEIDHVWSRDVIRQNIETSLPRLQIVYVDPLQN
jgi:aryl-alcohol dehydrogenase-like predicted oxidoreductase